MKKKTFVVLIIFCVVAPSLMFGSYQIGVNNGFEVGQQQGLTEVYTNGTTHINAINSQISYNAGYQAGFKAAQNQPSP
jgi:hypothetical protein